MNKKIIITLPGLVYLNIIPKRKELVQDVMNTLVVTRFSLALYPNPIKVKARDYHLSNEIPGGYIGLKDHRSVKQQEVKNILDWYEIALKLFFIKGLDGFAPPEKIFFDTEYPESTGEIFRYFSAGSALISAAEGRLFKKEDYHLKTKYILSKIKNSYDGKIQN